VKAGLAALGTLTVAWEKVLTGGSGGAAALSLLLLSEHASRQLVVSNVQKSFEDMRMAGLQGLIVERQFYTIARVKAMRDQRAT
jgi:hypothetical protein